MAFAPWPRHCSMRWGFGLLMPLSVSLPMSKPMPFAAPTVVCYADRFTPREEAAKARDEDREARTVAFLKRFTVFNLDQCENLPEDMVAPVAPIAPELAIAGADRVIQGSGVTFCIGGGEAFYSPTHDVVQVPLQAAFLEPINWFRTALHELGHATGHKSRLDRDQTGEFGSASYAKEELVAEMASAFACAALGIVPTVRHADSYGVLSVKLVKASRLPGLLPV
ncbi:ArdC family protein [Novosphingobium sp. BK486]|uniref:ArdC family protein n=2 Tax=unclassified Novosphingobium TaxID=2644732 RepID=UPI00351BE6D9